MLGIYLNQTAEYKAQTGTNDRGQPTYETAVSIPCRREKTDKVIITSTGEKKQAEYWYLLRNAVSTGDILDSKVVLSVSDYPDLSGKVIGYEAVT